MDKKVPAKKIIVKEDSVKKQAAPKKPAAVVKDTPQDAKRASVPKKSASASNGNAKPAEKKVKAAPAAKAVMKEGWMPGQKYEQPDENDGSRIFYESLHR